MRLLEVSIRSPGLRTTQEIAQDVSEAIGVVKKENPSLDHVINQSLGQYAYPLLGKKLRETIAETARQSGDLTEAQWMKLIDDEIDTFASLCQFSLDKAKAKKAILEEFVSANFRAVEEAWKTMPPPSDWYLRILDAHRVYAALLDNPERLSALEARYRRLYKNIGEALVTGIAVETSIRRQKAIVNRHSETAPPDLQQWSESCASVAIRDTFGRIGSVIVEGETVSAQQVDQSDTGRLRTAFDFSRQIAQRCSLAIRQKSGVEKSDEEIQALVNELMMRCCGEASFMFVFSPLSMMIGDTAIQEVDLSTLRPGFSQFRFSVDEHGNLVAEKVYVVQRKSLETGLIEYAQFTSKIEVRPDESPNAWTERVQTEAYGTALAKEVLEEARTSGKDVRSVFESRKASLKGQITNADDREKVIKDMERHLRDYSPEFVVSIEKNAVRDL